MTAWRSRRERENAWLRRASRPRVFSFFLPFTSSFLFVSVFRVFRSIDRSMDAQAVKAASELNKEAAWVVDGRFGLFLGPLLNASTAAGAAGLLVLQEVVFASKPEKGTLSKTLMKMATERVVSDAAINEWASDDSLASSPGRGPTLIEVGSLLHEVRTRLSRRTEEDDADNDEAEEGIDSHFRG